MRFPTKFNNVLKELYTPDEIKEIKSFINQTQVFKESYNKHANELNLPTLPNITNYGMRQKEYIKNALQTYKSEIKTYSETGRTTTELKDILNLSNDLYTVGFDISPDNLLNFSDNDLNRLYNLVSDFLFYVDMDFYIEYKKQEILAEIYDNIAQILKKYGF